MSFCSCSRSHALVAQEGWQACRSKYTIGCFLSESLAASPRDMLRLRHVLVVQYRQYRTRELVAHPAASLHDRQLTEPCVSRDPFSGQLRSGAEGRHGGRQQTLRLLVEHQVIDAAVFSPAPPQPCFQRCQVALSR